MPDTPDIQPVHFRTGPGLIPATGAEAACGETVNTAPAWEGLALTEAPGWVTCFACRRTTVFRRAQALDSAGAPFRIGEILAANTAIEAELDRVGAPWFQHDCRACRFIGGTSLMGQHYDLYFCDTPTEPNLLARRGNAGGEYVSGLSAVVNEPALALALAKAIHLGIFPASALGKI